MEKDIRKEAERILSQQEARLIENKNDPHFGFVDLLEIPQDNAIDAMLDFHNQQLKEAWIEIKSEDDLPKDDCDYWVVNDKREVHITEFLKDYKEFMGYLVTGAVTHYQPIVKPTPPLKD